MSSSARGPGGLTDALRRLFTDHIGLKLLSITAAIVLFSLVHGAEDAQRSIFVDVVAILPPSEGGKILISELPDRVKVTLQGTRSMLNSIQREELGPVQVDLTDPDLRYYYFEPTSFEVPAGVTIVQLAPASIPLTWADRVERRLSIAAQLTGELDEGLSAQLPVQVEPESVMVRGAQNEIDPLRLIQTEPIDITGLARGRHERRVRLMGPPPHAAYDHSATVSVLLEVVPEVDEHTVGPLDVEIVGPPGRVRPGSVEVTLRGPPTRLDGLPEDRIVPWVDGSDPTLVGTVPATVQLRGVPEDVEVVSIAPAEVLLTVLRRVAPPGPAP